MSIPMHSEGDTWHFADYQMRPHEELWKRGSDGSFERDYSDCKMMLHDDRPEGFRIWFSVRFADGKLVEMRDETGGDPVTKNDSRGRSLYA